MEPILFHLAFPVHDLEAARRFYVDGLGCALGRRSEHAMTLGLGGHQLVAHLSPQPFPPRTGIYPRHFGLIFIHASDWEALMNRARQKGLRFYQQPRRRFAGKPIEHLTFFLEDPSENLLEFKHYIRSSAIFGEHDFNEIGDAEPVNGPEGRD